MSQSSTFLSLGANSFDDSYKSKIRISNHINHYWVQTPLLSRNSGVFQSKSFFFSKDVTIRKSNDVLLLIELCSYIQPMV